MHPGTVSADKISKMKMNFVCKLKFAGELNWFGRCMAKEGEVQYFLCLKN